MKIVTDGKQYAVKKGWLIHAFADLNDCKYWWSSPDCVDKFCWGTLEEAKKCLKIRQGLKKVREHWDYKPPKNRPCCTCKMCGKVNISN